MLKLNDKPNILSMTKEYKLRTSSVHIEEKLPKRNKRRILLIVGVLSVGAIFGTIVAIFLAQNNIPNPINQNQKDNNHISKTNTPNELPPNAEKSSSTGTPRNSEKSAPKLNPTPSSEKASISSDEKEPKKTKAPTSKTIPREQKSPTATPHASTSKTPTPTKVAMEAKSFSREGKQNLKQQPYSKIKFEWTNLENWEWADGTSLENARSKFTQSSILVDRSIRKTPLRTRKGWEGEKIVFIEWIANENSDTNIWMLNTKIDPQFGKNNGWPFFGELDIFEMFTADSKLHNYDFSGFKGFNDVESYGQLTFHMGGKNNPKKPCFCPSSHSKQEWYGNKEPLTSACSAQFENTPNIPNAMATIFGQDSKGKYIQLIQNPTIIKGSNESYGFETSKKSVTTPRIYNNEKMFWGIPVDDCRNGGHNPKTGFPFFEEFRLILEEQGDGAFTVKNIQIFKLK